MCILFLWGIGKIFSIPFKKIFRLILNSILGGILIFFINVIGANFAFHIGLNIGTSIIVGLLGIPRCHSFNCAYSFFRIEYELIL